MLDAEGNMVGDVMHGSVVKELVPALQEAQAQDRLSFDFDRDGVFDNGPKPSRPGRPLAAHPVGRLDAGGR